MEFYLQVLDLFLSPRDTVVSIYAGGKIICAAWVCSADKLYQFHFYCGVFVFCSRPCRKLQINSIRDDFVISDSELNFLDFFR